MPWLWHQALGGRFNDYLDSERVQQNADKASSHFPPKGNPLMLLYKTVSEMLLEQVQEDFVLCGETWACSGR